MDVKGRIVGMTCLALVAILSQHCKGRVVGLPAGSPPVWNSLPEDQYENCGPDGFITDLTISNCQQTPCVFASLQEVTLEYAFMAVKDIERLNFDLNLIDAETEEVENIRHSVSTSWVEAGVKYESFTRFQVNSSFPEGKGLLLQILRSFEESRICALLPVLINSDTSTTPGTTESSESSTDTDASDDPATSTSISSSTCPLFICEEEGTFSDPCDCTAYHVCQHFVNGSLWHIPLMCPQPLVWCEEIFNCAFSSTCPC